MAIPADLQGLAQRLADAPKDPLTIQALADWLEDQGADPSCVRALTVDGPTVLVFGYSEPSGLESLKETAKAVGDFLSRATGHPIVTVTMPSGYTIRQIRADLKKGD